MRSSAPFANGERVLVHGLQSASHLNEREGTVTGWDASRARAGVRVDGERGAAVAVRPANLARLSDAPRVLLNGRRVRRLPSHDFEPPRLPTTDESIIVEA